MQRLILGLALVSCLFVACPGRAEERSSVPTTASAPPDALLRYVAAPESVYAWKKIETLEFGRQKVHKLELTSQTWQNIVWTHALLVFEPKKLAHPGHMLLFVTGGKNGGTPRDSDMAIGLTLAELCGARVATIHQVPNQPLLGDRVEDDLISETWLKYLETGDESWPLLFPMVKSAVKAMDALQEFVPTIGGENPEAFVISGASKRGWTSWLTPVADKRIIATAPIVIDMLNFRAQMKHQLELWGGFSEQINDYTRKGLVRKEQEQETERETRLRTMMDPWTYRQSLTLPKLLIVGTNDPYWAVDAMSIYFDDLVGPKYVLAAPNVGHNLGDRKDFALTTLAAFFRHQATGRPLPQLSWTKSPDKGRLELRVACDIPPRAVRVWSASMPTNDFREAKWASTNVEFAGGECVAGVPTPTDQKVALFTELEFDFDKLRYSLTTPVYRQ
jgi:PhoPQ-activated pathogenicity-related protein